MQYCNILHFIPCLSHNKSNRSPDEQVLILWGGGPVVEAHKHEQDDQGPCSQYPKIGKQFQQE